jgi:hypothetical protein
VVSNSDSRKLFLDGKRQSTVDNLRALIDGWLASEQLKVIEGADSNLEIGALSKVVGAEPEPPALLFGKIPGYGKDGDDFLRQRRTSHSQLHSCG